MNTKTASNISWLAGLFLVRAIPLIPMIKGHFTFSIAMGLYAIGFASLLICLIMKKQKWGLFLAGIILLLDIIGSVAAANWGLTSQYKPRNYRYSIPEVLIMTPWGVMGGAGGVWDSGSYSSMLFPDVFNWILGSAIGAIGSDLVFIIFVITRIRHVASKSIHTRDPRQGVGQSTTRKEVF